MQVLVTLLAIMATASAVSTTPANGWQRRLDRALLDVDRTPQARVRLLQKVRVCLPLRLPLYLEANLT